ncbi:autoinducer 2 ABC transporter substrate-binding protein [Agromyces aerolatus]|uniref:autoinducer 2 ABC transporter substrate-binding protein n=1 Tax=Agromyces sp. LY-1074 TaxID=3074080 RepID=UPI002855534A|nr:MULTISPECIES: autoinducer 2 ABC transporter substrate-binding protein [unclassified Agromyces]MDR5700876.1 autoinducer 2 ABC transporter substrate-binding protein [Agromyces sp. LY-1074]MDR5707463.1 autoinducer 2 ABC transporter substrate-binding protein [Agromyces sp. LY-1358]
MNATPHRPTSVLPAGKRRRRSRGLALVPIAVALVAGLAACSATTPEGGGDASAPADGEGTRVAFVSQIEGIPVFDAFNRGATAEAERLGITYTQGGPATVDATEQLRIFDSFVQQGYDAVSVSALDPASLDPAISAARAKGTVVITSDSDAPSSERQVMVQPASFDQVAKALVDQMVEAIGAEEGTYAIISGAPDSPNMNGWIDAIEAYSAEAYPGLELVGGVRYTSDTATALKETQDLLTAFPDLNGVFSIPSSALPGVAQAVETSGKSGVVQVVASTSPATARKFLESGTVYSTVLWDMLDLGALTVWAMNELVEGRTFEAEQTVPGLENPVTYDAETGELFLGEAKVFTTENMDDYDF